MTPVLGTWRNALNTATSARTPRPERVASIRRLLAGPARRDARPPAARSEHADHEVAERQRDRGERRVLVVVPVEGDPHELAQRRQAEERGLELLLHFAEGGREDHERVVVAG